MGRKMEDLIESIFDELRLYIKLFAGLLFVYGFIRFFRAIGNTSNILDWIEHAEKFIAGVTLVIIVADTVIHSLKDFYDKHVKEFVGKKEEQPE